MSTTPYIMPAPSRPWRSHCCLTVSAHCDTHQRATQLTLHKLVIINAFVNNVQFSLRRINDVVVT